MITLVWLPQIPLKPTTPLSPWHPNLICKRRLLLCSGDQHTVMKNMCQWEQLKKRNMNTLVSIIYVRICTASVQDLTPEFNLAISSPYSTPQSLKPPRNADLRDHVLQNLARLNLTRKGVVRLGDYPIDGGSFADIWKGSFRRREIAIKVPRTFQSSSTHDKNVIFFSISLEWRANYEMKKVVQELHSWSKLRHRHVLQLIGFVVEPSGRICLISPWNSNGSANKFLVGKPPEIIMNVVRFSTSPRCHARRWYATDHRSLHWSAVFALQTHCSRWF